MEFLNMWICRCTLHHVYAHRKKTTTSVYISCKPTYNILFRGIDGLYSGLLDNEQASHSVYACMGGSVCLMTMLLLLLSYNPTIYLSAAHTPGRPVADQNHQHAHDVFSVIRSLLLVAHLTIY